MDWNIETATTKMGNGLVIPWTSGQVACVAQIVCEGTVVNDSDSAQRSTLVISFLAQGQPHVAEVVYPKDLYRAPGAPVAGESTYAATLNVSAVSLPWYLTVLGGGNARVHMEEHDPSKTQLVVETFGGSRGSSSGGGGAPSNPPEAAPAPHPEPPRPVKPKPRKPPRPPKRRGRARRR